MYGMTEDQFALHRRDVEAGNVITDNPSSRIESPFYNDGSDLYIDGSLSAPSVDIDEILTHVATGVNMLEKKLTSSSLSAEDKDWIAYSRSIAEEVADDLKQRLDALSTEDKLYAAAIQDWVLAESSHLQAVDDTDELYLGTVDVLDRLLIELNADNEDPKLLALASTWRKELLADIEVSRLHKLYELAA